MVARVVWRFSDGKPGHDNQTLGLTEALGRLVPVRTCVLAPLPGVQVVLGLLRGRYPVTGHYAGPDLVLGAGHRTHLSVLAARRAYGGRAVVLMRPSLPLSWFDLCLVPEHDTPPARANVLATRGVLNRVRPSTRQDPHSGLFLIGGPSAHFGWDNEAVWGQIHAILAADLSIRWTLTTSRRTPAEFLHIRLQGLPKNLAVVPFAETDPDWLPQRLAEAARAWVSADSVSMVYEALTAGAAVGVLEVPAQAPSRVGSGLERLVAEGWVRPFRDWQRDRLLVRPAGSFDEATRCARWIVEHWLRPEAAARTR